MHDILDSQWDALSLATQTLPRSQSTSKINKKENRPPRPQDDFDSLVDSFISKPKLNQTSYLRLDDRDSFSPKFSQAPPRTSFGNHAETEENGLHHHFGNTQKSIFNPSKNNESSFVSSRNMKPPLRPRDNSNTQSIFASGTVILEEDPALTNSSRQKSMKRRSSIDARSELDEVPPLPSGTIQSVQFDTIKEDAFASIHKSQSCLINEGKQEQEPASFFRAKEKLQSKSESLKSPMQYDKKNSSSDSEAQQKFKEQLTKMAEHYQSQLDLLKKSYNEQIKHLEECLSKQINENRSLRAIFMEQTNKLLQEQRQRSMKIHEEEVQRTKDMLSWQQKKQEESLKMEIEALKKTLEMVNTQLPSPDYHKVGGISMQFQKLQLQSKESRVEAKLKELDQREMEIEHRESQIKMRMKREQDRLREQQKRISKMEMDFRTRMMEEKRGLAQDKQSLAIQMTELESDLLKKKDELMLKEKQLEFQLGSIEKEKQAMTHFNSQMLSKQKSDLDDLQRERERVRELQIQLVQKIKVVQLKGKEFSCNQEEWSCLKKNNWVDRPLSAQKKLNNSCSLSQLNKTKERFHLLEKNSRPRIFKNEKKIDLSSYMSRMESHLNRQP